MPLGRTIISVLVVLVIAAGFGGWLITSKTPSEARIEHSYPEGVAAVVPLGFAVGKPPDLGGRPSNPFGTDPHAVQEGKKLFSQMNCAGCHGYGATGGMGPNLTDTAWRYGGAPIDIYKSIYEGRPQGMPAWGTSLPPQTIWQLVSYIESLGGTQQLANSTASRPEVQQGQGAQSGRTP